MPSKSKKQAKTMRAVCHGAKLDRVKIPKKVACEFMRADQRKKKKKK